MRGRVVAEQECDEIFSARDEALTRVVSAAPERFAEPAKTLLVWMGRNVG
jgi:hypothetical protein